MNTSLHSTLQTSYTFSVRYVPLREEPDYTLLDIFETTEQIFLPQTKEADPFSCARSAIAKSEGRPTYVLIPGKKFDRWGTRHGHGGGWFDRFLSEVPSSWLRIGIATPDSYTTTPLIRNKWDQEVDWVIIIDVSNSERPYEAIQTDRKVT